MFSVFFSQAFFCGRSEYFNALLRDHFSETTADDGNPMVTIRNVPVEAFASVVYYIYTNAVQVRDLAQEYSLSLKRNLSRLMDFVKAVAAFTRMQY